MPQNAWSLIVFTLLTQMSVGAFSVAELINLSYSREFGFKNFDSLRFSSRLFVLLTMILAGVSSIFHLKNWAHAYFAFNNLKTSWLSKEMVSFFLFISCVALLAFISWRKIKVYLLQRIISIMGIISGIALIFSMSRIYMLPTIPVWDNWTTSGLFSTATLLLGSLSVVCLFTLLSTSSKFPSLIDDTSNRWGRKTLPNLVKLSLVFLVACLFVSGFFVYRLIWVAKEFGTEAAFMNPNKQIFFFLGVLFYVLGWILLLLFLIRLRQINGLQEKSLTLVYGAFIFIALAEILDRHLFFMSFFRVGL